MVFKRYIKRGGKLQGPYYYISYRLNGKVEKYYIGNENDYQQWKRANKFVVKQQKKKEKMLRMQKKERFGFLKELNRVFALNKKEKKDGF